MDKLIKILTPFKHLTEKERLYSTIIVIFILFTFWEISGNNYISSPIDIIKALPRLIFEKSLFENFAKSLLFCFKTISISAVIAYIISLMSIIPAFTVFCSFLRKFRFLPSTGLSFLFMKITPNIDSQMTWMMTFGITTWLIDGMLAVSLSITDDEISYAKSLRLSRLQMVKEIFIFGKSADIAKALISNFAMAWLLLASIENISKAGGGIGVVLAESNKYFKLEEVYAIQFLILATGIGLDYFMNKFREWMLPFSAIKK